MKTMRVDCPARPLQWGGQERGSVVRILSIALLWCAGARARLSSLRRSWACPDRVVGSEASRSRHEYEDSNAGAEASRPRTRMSCGMGMG
jgi:hypothetical protein